MKSKGFRGGLLKCKAAIRSERRFFTPCAATFIFISSLTLASGCSQVSPASHIRQDASPNPQTQWVPPNQAVEKQEVFQAKVKEAEKNAPAVPQEYFANIQNLCLADIVDIALLNSKQTRQAWSLARAAAADYGSAKGMLLPEIDASASANNQQTASSSGKKPPETHTYSGNVSLSWLLFDFGGRAASIEATREALYAADWNHNAAIQGVILQVEQAYYDYFATKALLNAQQSAVDESRVNLSSAEDRHSAGIATIADVLQSRTALSQAELTLQTLQGRIMTTRGILATAMGLPANTTFDVELPVDNIPIDKTKKSVDDYLATALKNRPDLAAVRAQAIAAEARLRAVRAQGYPSINAGGSVGRLSYDSLSDKNNIHSGSIGVSVPLFTGFSHRYDVLAARAQADAAISGAQNMQDIVVLQVWTSYYSLETAEQQVRTSGDLMQSATQNHDVAAERYKSGVGSILDLLTAQAYLEKARAQQIQARADWWAAAAQLAHDTGALDATPTPVKDGGSKTESKEGKQ